MAKVGRPTKYTAEFAKELGVKLLEWIKEPNNFWLGSFAFENMMNRARLSELAKKYPDEFSYAYLAAKQKQENKLFLGALVKKLDAFTAHNALKNVAGWRNDPSVVIDQSKKYVQIYRPERESRESVEANTREIADV